MNESVIFNAAIKLSHEQRSSFIKAACAGNPELEHEVDALLREHDEIGAFLDQPAVEVAATEASAPLPDCPGALIGPYKLLEQIGEGGMGLVYMAEQQQPVRRLVALKLVKPGMDSKQVLARFEAERQALAMMDHPNIAKVLDAGTVPFQISDFKLQIDKDCSASNLKSELCNLKSSGRPYFVMELVRGIPINEFCEQQKLTVRQRLELFIQVCHAVQHAHQKGIIHRDLKPTNVLVTKADTVPLPKVIDFGIAKALGASLTDHTLHTGFAQLVGTPMYMSPEQAEMNHFGVDTRSDVYSLGVLLYELLTGTTPFDKDRLKSVSFDELRRIIREEEPETVSNRIARTHREGSAHQPADVRPSSLVLRPFAELDWIVMKSLEKDRTHRYESASALAADIQRYLSDEPVHAYPPTPMYRFQKFARKHQPALFTAAAIALCLLLGTTVSAWQAVRATEAESQAKEAAAAEAQQRQRAEANEQKANTQRDEAQRQRDEVKALNEKLLAMQAELRATLYATRMHLAQQAWDLGGADRVRELLELATPKPGEIDLRGFEWHYLHRLCHADDLLTLKGHMDRIDSIAFSPDGRRLASASWDHTVKLWDALTGQELLTFKGHTGPVERVAFSPDGKRLVSDSQTWDEHGKPLPGELRVWDSQTGRESLFLTGRFRTVAFSPDGTRLAAGSGAWDDTKKAFVDVALQVWDAQTGQELLTIKGHTGAISSIAFSPDGKRLACGSRDRDQQKNPITGQLKIWDAQTGQELLTLKGHTGWAASVCFSPDGKRLASASDDKTVRLWDSQIGQELVTLKHVGGVWDVAFSPDGKRLASVTGKGEVKLWDPQTGQELLTVVGPGGYSCVAFGPDGQLLASGASDGTVTIWNATPLPEKP